MDKTKPIKTDPISDQGAKTSKLPRKPRAKRTTKPEHTGSSGHQTTPSSPAPATDAVSTNCANKRENKPNTRDENETADTSQTQGDGIQEQADSTREDGNQTPQTAPTDSQHDTGDDLLGGAESMASDGSGRSFILHALAREGEGRAACWERLRKESRAAGMVRGQGPGSAYEWATREVERLFPPKLPDPEPIAEEPIAIDLPDPAPFGAVAEPEFSPIGEKVVDSPPKDDQGVPGLGDLPADWGVLPANASLQVEISWVSANRLRVRDGTGVDLAKALSPAPSYSALSWLETSILFPSKFADISVKATANQDDEKEAVRREKLAIEEVRAILAEMLEG